MAINKVTTDVIDMSGNTGGLVWAKGATGDQPLPVDSTAGDLRENTTTGKTEVFNGTAWRNLKEAAPPPLTVDFLVVAGGGAGGSLGGGGGAGGLRTTTTYGGAESSLSLTAGTPYDVEVGPGGATSNSYSTNGSAGTNSVFATITSNGGGTGQSRNGGTTLSQNGGSGGGSTDWFGANTAGTGTANQGFGGGVSTSPVNPGGGGGTGGGGGAGSVGANFTGSGTSGDGGSGLEVNIIGGTGNFYAGGGGGGDGSTVSAFPGGAGGSGVGGNGGNSNNPGTDGTPNTGGGAGGSGNGSTTAGTGGSGIVILRYPSSYSVTVGVGLSTGVLNGTVSGGTDKYTTFTAGTGTITFS